MQSDPPLLVGLESTVQPRCPFSLEERSIYLRIIYAQVMLEAPSGFRVETEPAVPTQVRAPADTTVQGEKEERDMGRGAEGGAGPSAAVPVDANEAGAHANACES